MLSIYFQDKEPQYLLHVKASSPIGVILLCDREKEGVGTDYLKHLNNKHSSPTLMLEQKFRLYGVRKCILMSVE